jgi:uncharacterized protein
MEKTELELTAVIGESPSPDVTPPISPARPRSAATRITRILFLVLILLIILSVIPRGSLAFLDGRLQTFSTIFLGIFIEAVPFLLIGSLVSGLIAVFMDQETLMRFIPRRAVPATMVGAMLGIVFPVCECGVVPVTRRLYQKGLPISVGIAFLLSAPVINPIVVASTFVAFGWGPVLIGRYVLTFIIAFAVGLIFHFAKPEEIILPAEMTGIGLADSHKGPTAAEPGLARVWQAVVTAADDFLDMSRYLILGSLLAAGMQTFISQSALIQFGEGQVLSVMAMMTLAFVLSICSTVDAFLALSFASTFTTGSILGFLVFGPMVDIKSALMFLGVFRRKVVLYLILLPLLFTLLFALIVNLYLGL